jgi:FAD/FMN-containing dehydrogenase
VETTDTAGKRTDGRVAALSGVPVWNWTKEHVSYPRAVVDVDSADQIATVLGDPKTYPAPVRGLASRHSTSRCGEADGGTIVDVRRLNRIIRIGPDSVTTEPGALYIDVAQELEKHDLQFYVNIELGNLSMGAGAMCATKDASMPGEFGQVNSYAIGMKLVTASGELVEITEDDPDLLQAARSSYGLFGIATEVTFRVRPLQAMAVRHEIYTIDEFARRLPELIGRGQSMMFYVYPFLQRIVIEFRSYAGAEAVERKRNVSTHAIWKVRNKAWKTVSPTANYFLERYVPWPGLRFFGVNAINRLTMATLFRALKAEHTIPTDQIIRYPPVSGRSGYTFSIWAFPEERYGETLKEYCKFAQGYYRRRGWRPNMLHVGYRIAQDQSSLFSYTHDWTGITIDPVCTGSPRWPDFLDAYNEYCSERGGAPLLNQTPRLTREQVHRAFGEERIGRFEQYRRRFDPDDRLLNGYFRDLLQSEVPART